MGVLTDVSGVTGSGAGGISSGGGGGGGGITLGDVDTNRRVEYRTLILADISGQGITLSNSPATATKTELYVMEGQPAEYTADFSVVGNALSWAGGGLDGILAVGDKLKVVYFTT
jgi:hypothetical protein